MIRNSSICGNLRIVYSHKDAHSEGASIVDEKKRQDEFRERARKLIGDVKKGANPSSSKGSGSSKLRIAECNYKINDVSSSCPLKELSCSNTTDTEGDGDNIHRRVPVTPLQSFTTLIERISFEKKMNTQLEVKSLTNYAKHTNYIQNELTALERGQKAIDNEADMLEKYLRKIIKSGNDHEQEVILMTKWFTLVNKLSEIFFKNDLSPFSRPFKALLMIGNFGE